MQYALIAYARGQTLDALTDEERAAWEADDAEFEAGLADRGVVVWGAPMAGVDTATTVQVANGRVVLTDGPFADVGHHVVGARVVDVPDLDAALDLARHSPAARTGPLEVRPIMT